MTTQRLIPVATFATPEEAEIGRSVLDAEGIPSFLENSNTVGMLWHLGNATGWVKLLVGEDHAEQAAELLQPTRREDARGILSAPWSCTCGAEVDAGFETCWQCGSTRDVLTTTSPSTSDALATSREPAPEPTTTTDDLYAEAIDRAWKAAVFGCMLLPVVLNIYSIGILLQHLNTPLDDRRTRRFYVAWLLNVSVLALFVWLFW
ncbi:MAG: DUF2007 domain-containing protein [Planctomycetaceae bacterium]|nr:DUF2007 domain-containing protein [Planctomycetaceae bacterium]